MLVQRNPSSLFKTSTSIFLHVPTALVHTHSLSTTPLLLYPPHLASAPPSALPYPTLSYQKLFSPPRQDKNTVSPSNMYSRPPIPYLLSSCRCQLTIHPITHYHLHPRLPSPFPSLPFPNLSQKPKTPHQSTKITVSKATPLPTDDPKPKPTSENQLSNSKKRKCLTQPAPHAEPQSQARK